MSDLLVTAIVDLGGEGWPGPDTADRVAGSMLLGLGGDVRCMQAGSAFLAARTPHRHRHPGRRPQVTQVRSDPAMPAGLHCLLAGTLHDIDSVSRMLGLPPDADKAAMFAHAYARWGDDVENRLHGDYAAILWHDQETLLRLSRSPLSRQPLHVWRDGPHVVASSTPRAIFAAGIPSYVDDDRLADLLLLNLCDPNSSRYAGLSRVGPGHVAHHRPGGARIRRYWAIDDLPKVRFSRDEDYAEAASDALAKAVAASTENLRKPGMLLSGGLDSQAVAAFALARADDLPSWTNVPAPGFTPVPRPDSFADESDHVRALAAMYPGLEPHFLHADPDSLLPCYDRFLMLAAWPGFNEGGLQWVGKALHRASTLGCDAMLCGDAGNIGFSYGAEPAIAHWARSGRLIRATREILFSGDDRGIVRRTLSLAVRPNLPASLQHWIDRKRSWAKPVTGYWNALSHDFARDSGAFDRARAAGYDPHGAMPRTSRAWRGEVAASLASETAEISLGLELLHGVPLRDPLAYRPLVELCAGMPDDQFLHRGTNRWLARRVLEGRVPEIVRTETRMGRQSADWPLRFAASRESLLAELESMQRDPRLARIIDFPAMARDLAAWPGTDDPQDGYTMRIAFRIGRAVMAARFVRHVEGRNVG